MTGAPTANPFSRVPFPAGAVKADWQDLGSPNAFRHGSHSAPRPFTDRPQFSADEGARRASTWGDWSA